MPRGGRSRPSRVRLCGPWVLHSSDPRPDHWATQPSSCRQPSFWIAISPSIFTAFRLPVARRSGDPQKLRELLSAFLDVEFQLQQCFLVCLRGNGFPLYEMGRGAALELSSLVSKTKPTSKWTRGTYENTQTTTQSSCFLLAPGVGWRVELGRVGQVVPRDKVPFTV